MLDINWSDVWATASSVLPQLIVIGSVLVLAIIITIAVIRMPRNGRRFARAQTWIAAIAVIAVATTTMLYGGLKNVLDLASGSGALTEKSVSAAEELGNEIADEGMVLLKNTEGALPLPQTKKLNVFGWASTNPIYGGTGSGSLSDSYELTSLLDGLHNAGFETNDDLTDLYTDYRAERPEVAMFSSDWTLPEVPADDYPSDLLTDAKEYSDTAVVTIARAGGEGYDLPHDIAQAVADDPTQSFENNTDAYDEFDEGHGLLELTHSERDMLALAEETNDNVVVVYNGANAMELGELQDDPNVDAIVWALPPGQVGFDALGRILSGEVNPSAKTPDTFVRDLDATPTSNNFGHFGYTNMDEFSQESPFSGAKVSPSFVNYVEGIYVGYRFWETAAVEGAIDYDESVVYPFGYGLSYTEFDQKIDSIDYADGTVTVTATVTNTGDVAGKDVVQVYDTPPYTEGGIEKSAVNLVDYAKTQVLEPGASETVEITFDDDALASYDEKTAKAYVLEAGDYEISLRSDSHTVIDSGTIAVDKTVTYDAEGATHDGDAVAATNRFDEVAGDVEYLSRADGFANYDKATAAPTQFELPDERKSEFVVTQNFDAAALNDPDDEMPTTGADNGLVLGDLAGADYDDPRWEELLDQMTFDEMDNLIANGGYQTPAATSVGKIQTLDVDGPASLNNNFTGVGSIGLPVSVAVAASFNKDLAHEFGTVIGQMAEEMGVSGWYAPAMNTHRSAYAGRNFEYFSEDPTLAGAQAAAEVTGARELGVYAFVKHFGLNDQETDRTNMLLTWTNEQAMREIYLRPFETAVKDGGAGAVMSAFNFIGTVYAGADPALLNSVLRDEWGFRGMVLTDYFAGYGYQNADQIIRGGGDVMLATVDMGVNHVQDTSATSVIAMRQATKNILYTVANSREYADGQPEIQRAAWEYIVWAALALIALVLIWFEYLAIRRYLRRRRDAKAAVTEASEEAGAPGETEASDEAKE